MSPGEDLLKDDRFLMFADKHWETMCDDHRYVVDAKSQVWEWLSQIAGCSDDADADLRGQAIWSSLASLAYTFRDSFERLHRLPLSLTQGDLGDNLEKLSQIDYADLTDEFSQRMRMSMELGVDLAVLEGVLRLCREAPCCTNLVEQGHGSGAATLQAHSQFGTRSLQVRSSIHQCRALFSSLPRQHLIERLDKAISKKLRAINGPRYEARCAFLLFLQNDPYHERPDDMNPSAWSKVCFAAHRERFYKLPWAQQMEFQAEADVIDMRRMSLWQDELRELQERRSSALHQLAEDLDEVASKPNLVSSHRLGIDDLHRCADVVESVRSSTTLAAMREQLLKSTEEPDPGMLQLLRGAGHKLRAAICASSRLDSYHCTQPRGLLWRCGLPDHRRGRRDSESSLLAIDCFATTIFGGLAFLGAGADQVGRTHGCSLRLGAPGECHAQVFF